MKFIKRCLSVMVAAAVITAGIPMAFSVMGEETDIIKLSTLQNFSGSTEETKVSSGGSFSLVNSGAAGGGKAVKVNTSGASSWALVELSVPLSDKEIGAAKGLLIYTEWNDNLNCYVSVSGSNSEGTFSTAPKQWKNPPVFDAASGKWIATDAAGNPGSIALKHNFKGYIYLPFSILDTALTPDTVIDTVTFKGFNTDSHTPYTIGSIYLVENDVLPADYYGSPQYPSDVELDGQAVSLIRKLELSTFESFKDGEIKYSVTSGANLEVMSGTRAIGGGNTLKVETSAIGEWQTATVTFPADIEVSTAKGLFVYVQWGGNRNCFITVEGIKDGKNVSGSFEQWTHSIPLYDTLADEWISKAIGFAGDVRNGVTIDGNNGIIARLYIDTTLAIGNSVAVYLKACHVALSKNSISAGFVSGKCAVLDCHIAVSSRVRHSETSFKFAVFESQICRIAVDSDSINECDVFINNIFAGGRNEIAITSLGNLSIVNAFNYNVVYCNARSEVASAAPCWTSKRSQSPKPLWETVKSCWHLFLPTKGC